MLTTEYLLDQVHQNEQSCTVYREPDGGSYGSSLSDVGETALWLFDANATSSIQVEGADEDTSFTAMLRPSVDLADGVQVGDEIQFDGHPEKRYVIRTKVGIPTALDPTVWRLGVDRANA